MSEDYTSYWGSLPCPFCSGTRVCHYPYEPISLDPPDPGNPTEYYECQDCGEIFYEEDLQ